MNRISPFLLICCVLAFFTVPAQDCSTCTSVKTVDIDLSAQPDTVWVSPVMGRQGQCCQGTGSDVCIRFNIKTHPDADQLGFTLAEPPIPPSMEYSLNCGTPQSVDIPLCISGAGPHCIVYCKPGGDELKYQITTAKTVEFSPDIIVGEGCQDTLWVDGFETPSIRWNVVYPDASYNSYLSCTAGCETTYVTAQAGYPDYIDVEVSGYLQSPCTMNTAKDTMRVYFVSDKTAEIQPPNPTICFGGTGIELTAEATGGQEPYNYKWSTGETTQSIFVTSAGDYSVEITDVTDCPPVEAATTVDQHFSEIDVLTGDGNVCVTAPTIQLEGEVLVAKGGEWSGGNGTFFPNEQTIDAYYTFSSDEVAANSATLTLTSTGNGGCPGDSEDLTITLSPEPNVFAGNDTMVCLSDIEVQLYGSVTDGASDGVWSTLGTGTFSNTSNLRGKYYPSSADTAAGSVTLILSSIANGPCLPIKDTMVLTFGNEPKPDFDFTRPACSGQNIQFTNLSTVGWGVIETYQWDFGNSLISSDEEPFTSYTAPGDYEVTLNVVSDKGCPGVVSHTVTVSEDPVADFTSTEPCFGKSMNFTDLSTNAVEWYWDFGNGLVSTQQNPQGVIFDSEGSHTVTLTVENASGCLNAVQKDVNVLPRPIASFNVDNICVGDNVTFYDNSGVVDDVIVSWEWDFGGLAQSTDKNPTQSFDVTTPINVKLKVSTNSCSDSTIKQVTPLKAPSFSLSPSNGCTPMKIDFYNNVQPNVNYKWEFGDGNTSTSPSPEHVFVNDSYETQVYDIKLTAQSIFGCVDEAESSVTVYPKSKSSFAVSSSQVCSNQTVDFTNNSENAISYYWDFGDGSPVSIDFAPSHLFINETDEAKYIPVSLITQSEYDCFDTTQRYINVFPIPESEISLSETESCSPAEINMSTESGAMTYFWKFGDGAFEQGSEDMSHTYENATSNDQTFTIDLVVTSKNNCVYETSADIVVHPSPTTQFETDLTMGCAPLEVVLVNQSAGAIDYQWNYGDDDASSVSSAVHTHTFENKEESQKSYLIELVSTNEFGCSTSLTSTINVFPEVVASFTNTPEAGCSPWNVEFANTSTGGVIYKWFFGDDNFSTNPQVTSNNYTNIDQEPKTYEAYLVAQSIYYCEDTSDVLEVTVNPSPVVEFAPSVKQGCSPIDLVFNNNTQGAASYHWNFGDGTTGTDETPMHKYINADTASLKRTISLTANNQYNCPTTVEESVTIYPEVEAQFFMGPKQGCSPLDVVIENHSKNAIKYEWDFGDETVASTHSPSKTFINEGTTNVEYEVQMIAVSQQDCADTVSSNVTVYPTPEPNFTLSASYVELPNATVFIENLTEGENLTYHWTFGDNTYSYDEQPGFHQYHQMGEYRVLLEVNGLCSDTISLPIIVGNEPIVIDYDTAFVGCVPLTVTFTNKTTNADSYKWNFNDGSAGSLEEHPTHEFTEPGTYPIELTASNGIETVTESKHTVTVYPSPKAEFEVAPSVVHLPDATVSLYDLSTDGYKYIWYFGSVDTSHAHQPTYTYTEEGLYDIGLKVESINKCTDSIWKPEAVEVLLNCDMAFPNAFSPNGTENGGYYNIDIPETTNDIFHPIFRNIEEYNLQIFNRWGELVFESNELDKGWDGFYKGKLSKSDVYVWQVEATCYGGRKIHEKGNLTLMK